MAKNNMTAFDILMSRSGRKTTGAKNTAQEDIQKIGSSANEFQNALISTLSQPSRATDGPAQVQQQSNPQPMTGGQRERYAISGAVAQAIQTPELDSFRGNATGNTWEDTNALARQLDAEKAREAELQKTPERNVGGGLTTRQFEQAHGERDFTTGDVLANAGRRLVGDTLGGVRDTINYYGSYVPASIAETVKDPSKSPNRLEQFQYDFDSDPHAMDAYNAWKASLKPGEYEALEMSGQLPDPRSLYAQQRLQQMSDEYQKDYVEPELKSIVDFGRGFQAETEEKYGNMTGLGGVIGDLAGTIGQMSPAMALNRIPYVGPVASTAYLLGSAAGNATEQAYANGASLQQAVDYGTMSGAVEAATEKMFDGMAGLLGKGAADDIVESVIGKLTSGSGNNALRNALRLGFGALGEGAEEGISALADPILQSIYNNQTVRQNYKDIDWSDVLYQIELGALSGGVLGSLGMVNGQFSGKNAALNQQVVNEVVNDVLTNTPEGQAVAQRAQEAASAENPLTQTILANEQGQQEQGNEFNAPQPVQSDEQAQGNIPAPAEQANAPQPGQGTQVRVQPAPADAEGTKLSNAVKTVQNAKVTTDEMNALIDRSVQDGGSRYFPITNDETVQKVTATIQRDGWAKALADWTAAVRQGKASAEITVMGQMLFNNAVNAGDQNAAMDIYRDYIASGTNMAQAMQARRILSNMAPEARLYAIEKSVQSMLDELGNAVPEGVHISEELKQAFLEAPNEQARDEVISQIQKDLARQMPVRFIGADGRISWKNVLRKWTALRYMNMLGNLKTQARNLIGNTTMAALTTAKNAVQTLFERVASAATGGRYQRTTSLFVDSDLRNAAMDYYRAHADTINGEGKYSDMTNPDAFLRGIEKEQQVFGDIPVIGKGMEAYRRATTFATEAGDTIFIGPRFARTLAGYLKANGMDAATFSGIQDGSIQATAEQRALIDKAVNYATQEAQEATFHDNNTLSSWISKVGRGKNTPAAIKATSEGIMPFRKTPANVFVRMEEYSPLGFINATVEAIQAAKGKNNVTGADVVNSLAKATTGTGIFLLGMLLRNAGWLTGHEDDDKQRNFNDLRGGQEYALTLPNGTSFTLDWNAPTSGILFMGAQLMDAVQDGGFQLKDLEKAFTSITDPMIQMSMLQGVNDTLDNIKYSDNNLMQIALSSAVSYLSQGLTNSLAGQLERTIEDRRTSTYVDKDSNLPAWIQRSIGKTAEKIPIPGVEYNQAEYLDAWGRPEMYEENVFARAFNNFLNPGYVSKDNSTEVDNELQRLYDAGMGNVFPQRISMSDKIAVYDEHGQATGQRQLTADEYVQVQREAGQNKLQMVKDLMASPVYDGMSDEARADAISAIYQYANYEAIRKVEPSHEDKYSDISGLSNIPAYFAAKEAYQDAADNRWNRDYEELDNMLDSFGNLAPDVQKALTEKVDNFGKVYDAYQGGVSAENWYKAYDAKTDLEPYGDNKSVANWQEYQAMANVSSDKDMDVILRGYMQDSAYESYMTARNDGLSAKDWADARAAAGMLTPPEGKENVPDALQYQAYATVLDNDGMDAMMHATLEEGSYDKYVAARDAGISAENWANAWASTVGLAPLEGHKDVTDAQKWQAMAGTVSDKDMDALMRANLSEGALRDYTDARNAGISAQLWADTRAAVEQLPVLEGRSKIADFQAAYYIGSNSSLSNKEKDALMGLYLTKGENGKMSTYEKYMACRGAGFAPQHLAKFLEFKATAGKKDDVIAAAMRYGFSEKNALALWNMFQSGHW